MIITTTETVPGYEIVSIIGIVDGSAVWYAKAAGTYQDFLAVKTRVDMDKLIASHQYKSVDCMNDAIDDMEKKAEKLSADAIIGFRVSPIRGAEFGFGTQGSITEAGVVMYVYGTAVKTRRVIRIATSVDG